MAARVVESEESNLQFTLEVEAVWKNKRVLEEIGKELCNTYRAQEVVLKTTYNKISLIILADEELREQTLAFLKQMKKDF